MKVTPFSLISSRVNLTVIMCSRTSGNVTTGPHVWSYVVRISCNLQIIAGYRLHLVSFKGLTLYPRPAAAATPVQVVHKLIMVM